MTSLTSLMSRPTESVRDPARPERGARAGTAGQFFQQLSPSGYARNVRPGQARRDRPRRTGLVRLEGEPQPCVLLLSRSCDAELGPVCSLLGRVGITAVRIDADELGTADLVVDPDRGTLLLDGAWLTPTITWSRHFSGQAIEAAGSPVADLFRRESWQSAARQLAALSPVSIDSPHVGLLQQRSVARRRQIATPRTIVTTDPGQARDFLGTGSLVIKAVGQHFVEASPGMLSGVFPVIMASPEPLPAPRPGIPVMVQEYVEHEAEFRAYYVDGEVLGFEVRKEAPADPWLATDRVAALDADLPGPVARAARLLATDLGLHFGAFDFLLSGGIPVFLEVNPDGDWRWAEEKAGTTRVTAAVARMLCRLHRGALPAGRRAAGALDLIRFLSDGRPA